VPERRTCWQPDTAPRGPAFNGRLLILGGRGGFATSAGEARDLLSSWRCSLYLPSPGRRLPWVKTLGWLQTVLDCGLTTELVMSTAAVPHGRYAHFFSWPYAAFWTSGECWGSRSLRVLQQSSESDIVRAGPLRLRVFFCVFTAKQWTGPRVFRGAPKCTRLPGK
jgi:hypothetical protein